MSAAPLLPVLLTALAAAPAWAGWPLVTETADAIGLEACELEAAFAHASASGLSALRMGEAFFSCGLLRHSQAGLGITRASGNGLHVDTLRLAGKTTFLMPHAQQYGWGLAYALAADNGPDSGWRTASFGVMAVATRALAPGLLGHANLGWSHSRSDRQDSTVWSLGVESTSDLSWAADVYGDDRSRPSVSTGVGLSLGSGFSASLSYALQFETPRVKQLTLGAKLAF